MKKFWHTWTLFIQAWKYKWSYKHDYCIECWKCDFKHKWNWLCTSCWEKKRDNTKRRKEVKRKAWLKRHQNNYQPRERKKRESNFDKEKYKKEWYQKNHEAILLKAKADRMRKKWIQVLKMIINWKEKYFPWEWLLEKPITYINNFKKYEERKEQQRQFIILKNYYARTLHTYKMNTQNRSKFYNCVAQRNQKKMILDS